MSDTLNLHRMTIISNGCHVSTKCDQGYLMTIGIEQ